MGCYTILKLVRKQIEVKQGCPCGGIHKTNQGTSQHPGQVEPSLPFWQQIEWEELMDGEMMLPKSQNRAVGNAFSQHVKQMQSGDCNIPEWLNVKQRLWENKSENRSYARKTYPFHLIPNLGQNTQLWNQDTFSAVWEATPPYVSLSGCQNSRASY